MSTRWPLAAYTITLPHLMPGEAVVAVRDAGYAGIEWSVHSHPPYISRQPTRLHRNDVCYVEPKPEAVKHARALSQSAGLRISGLGLGGQFNRPEGASSAFDLGEIAGAPFIRIQAGSTLEGASYASAFDAAVRVCDAYVREAERHPDVKVVLHQHWGTVTASAAGRRTGRPPTPVRRAGRDRLSGLDCYVGRRGESRGNSDVAVQPRVSVAGDGDCAACIIT